MFACQSNDKLNEIPSFHDVLWLFSISTQSDMLNPKAEKKDLKEGTYCDHSSPVADYKHKWRYIWVSSKKRIAKKIYSNNYLTETNIGHLKLVLVNWSSQATVKEFNTSTQSTLLTKNVIKHNTLKVKYSNILDSLYYIEHKDWKFRNIFCLYYCFWELGNS